MEFMCYALVRARSRSSEGPALRRNSETAVHDHACRLPFGVKELRLAYVSNLIDVLHAMNVIAARWRLFGVVGVTQKFACQWDSLGKSTAITCHPPVLRTLGLSPQRSRSVYRGTAEMTLTLESKTKVGAV